MCKNYWKNKSGHLFYGADFAPRAGGDYALLCVQDFEFKLLLNNVCCRLKAAGAKLEEAIKHDTEEMEQYVKLTNHFITQRTSQKFSTCSQLYRLLIYLTCCYDSHYYGTTFDLCLSG